MSANGRQQIVAANLTAQMAGILPNLSLADARALCPALNVYQADPVADLKSLTALRAACERYTPWVAVDPFSGAAENSGLRGAGLWLDVTGCTHLFGSEEALLKDLLLYLKRLGYRARAGLAATPGTAWALARYKTNSQTKRGFILPAHDDMRTSVASLPIAGLRLSTDIVEGLERMGIRYIGDLYEIPRGPLTSRFGGIVLRRLDQALGTLIEPLSPQRFPPTFLSRLTFAEPIARTQDIEAALAQLLDTLCIALAEAEQGARKLVLTLFRVDHSIEQVQVGTSQPERDPAHLARLFQERLYKVDPGFGIEVIFLLASETNSLEAQQIGLDGVTTTEQMKSAAKLVDRLAGRLGFSNITRLQPVASHLPELAFREVPTASIPTGEKKDWKRPTNCQPRPLQLLLQPLPIQVVAPVPDGPPVLFHWRSQPHRIVAVEGPERITPEWWNIEENIRQTWPLNNNVRDYYRIEDENGRRYWFYREGLYRHDKMPRWYIHGFFT